MDAEELRIGNLVNVGEAIQSLPIEAGIQCAVLIVGKTQYFGTIRKISEVKPILLTKKWLLNFGFEAKSIEGYFDVKDGKNLDFKIVLNPPFGSTHLRIGNFEVKIKYVHQLQNLYLDLIQKKLTIKEKEA